MWCKSQDTGITERQLFVPGRGGFNILGHCWAGNIAFISSLLKGLFLNNGDVPGFENTAMGEEVLVRKKWGMGVKYWGGENVSSSDQQSNRCVSALSFESSWLISTVRNQHCILKKRLSPWLRNPCNSLCLALSMCSALSLPSLLQGWQK